MDLVSGTANANTDRRDMERDSVAHRHWHHSFSNNRCAVVLHPASDKCEASGNPTTHTGRAFMWWMHLGMPNGKVVKVPKDERTFIVTGLPAPGVK